MSDILSFPYAMLGEEGQFVSMADAAGQDRFHQACAKRGIVMTTHPCPLREANTALADLRAGRFDGAALLTP